ncbi:hypothetical protein Hanom_Chr12g01093101 [Helianthus anomalus]
MITLFTDFFVLCNLRLPLTVFMAEFLEYNRIHISQLSPLGMVRARHFDYCFRSQDVEPKLEDFRRFYQMHAQVGIYSFRLRDNAPKFILAPSMGFTTWKSKFFYVREAAVACKQYFRDVSMNIPKEKIHVPEVGVSDWADALQVVPIVALDNRELMYLLVRFQRSFPEAFEGKIAVEECGEGEQGLYEATVAGFWLLDPTALKALLPQGQGNVSMFVYILSLESDILEEIVFAAGKLGALGDPSAVAGGGNAGKTVPLVVAMVRKAKKPEKLVTIQVKQVTSGTFRPQISKSKYYTLVSDTLEGLGVPGSSSSVEGLGAGTGPNIRQKRKADTAPAGAEKKLSLSRPRAVTLSTCMPQASVAAKPPTLTPPSSPPKVADEEEKKEEGGPEVQVLSSEGTTPPPPVQSAERFFENPTVENGVHDTVDSSGNLIDLTAPRGSDGDVGDKSQKSPVQENVSSSGAAGKGSADQPPIQLNETELDYYYRTYSGVCGLDVHSLPGVLCKGM